MSKVLGLTKNNDQYEDVPDELKWAVPLHEHLTSPKMKRWFDNRQAEAEQRVQFEMTTRQREASKKRLRILGRAF